ncbi:MAG: SRPBCC family protein [Tepidisphaeraceae bacterium]|jgi:hypothetical protein
MKRWLVYILAAVVACAIVILAIGSMLPRSHRATRMAEFNQPPQAIFAAITGPQDWRGVTTTDLTPSGGTRRWREQSGRWSITFEEAESDPPRLFRSRIVGEDLPFSGTWTWQIAPTKDGCTCRITEEGSVNNPFFRFVSRFIMGQTRTIDGYLEALGRKFGEPVKIEN